MALVFRMASVQPIAGVDEFLFFALVAFNGDEHGPDRVPKRCSRGA